MVTSIPIPRYSDIKKKPLGFNCTFDLNRKEAKTYGSYQYKVHEYCAKVQPYIHDLYAALPELHPEYDVQNDKPNASPSSSPDNKKELNREKGGIGTIFSRLDHPGSREPILLDKR